MKKPATLRELNGLTQGCRVIYDDQGKKLFGFITISADMPEGRVHGVCVYGVTYDTVALDNVSATTARPMPMTRWNICYAASPENSYRIDKY